MAIMRYNCHEIRLLSHERTVFFFARVDVNARFHCFILISIARAGNALSWSPNNQSHCSVLTLSVSAASESQNTIHLTKMQALFKQNTMIISWVWELGARDFPTAGKVNKKPCSPDLAFICHFHRHWNDIARYRSVKIRLLQTRR